MSNPSSSVTRIINESHYDHSSTFGNNTIGESLSRTLTPDLNLSSAYAFDSFDDLSAYHLNKLDEARYGRDSSEISMQCEYYFDRIFECEKSFLTSSGMSAINLAFKALVDKNTKAIVTFGIFYRKTLALIEQICDDLSLPHINIVNNGQFDLLKQDFDAPFVFLVENPSNPFLTVTDLSLVSKQVFPNSSVIVDISLAGLANHRFLSDYADIVVTSCTKYIGGHNDLIGGIIAIYSPDIVPKVWNLRSTLGSIMSPFAIYLLLRSLRTYDLRLNQSVKNCSSVLSFLSQSNSVSDIFYPGSYNNSHQSEVSDKYLDHGGAVVSFTVNLQDSLLRRIESLRSTKMAPTFGSIDSIIEIPLYMSRGGIVPQRDDLSDLELILYNPNFVRLSIGSEPSDIIFSDLEVLLGNSQ